MVVLDPRSPRSIRNRNTANAASEQYRLGIVCAGPQNIPILSIVQPREARKNFASYIRADTQAIKAVMWIHRGTHNQPFQSGQGKRIQLSQSCMIQPLESSMRGPGQSQEIMLMTAAGLMVEPQGAPASLPSSPLCAERGGTGWGDCIRHSSGFEVIECGLEQWPSSPFPASRRLISTRRALALSMCFCPGD